MSISNHPMFTRGRKVENLVLDGSDACFEQGFIAFIPG